jgi:hypothetical protein
MTGILTLLYVLFIVIGICVSILETYQERLSWGELLSMVGISLVPLLNMLFIAVYVVMLVKDSNILKKKVF